jgi:hypothetical protein
MKLIFIFVILISGVGINKINSLKTEAMEDYKKGSFDLAEKKLAYLKDSLGVNEAPVVLNLASSQYLQGKTEEAFNNYKSVAGSKDAKYSSRALQQMGVISYETEKYSEALEAFKQSLIRDPENVESRYNYELVKKRIKEQPKDQKDQEKDQENKEDQPKEKDQNKEQDRKDGEKDNENNKEEKSDQKPEGEENEQESEKDKDSGQEESQDKEKPEESEEEKGEGKEDQNANPQKDQPNFEEMKISPEVAKMILQAMENREMQYFQQLKKEATKSNNKKSKW